jgi:hypothetical protein
LIFSPEEITERVFENRALKPKLESKSFEITVRSSVLMYFYPNVIRVRQLRMMRWVGPVARVGALKNKYKNVYGRSECKSSLAR